MKHSLCSEAGDRGASSELQSDNVFVQDVCPEPLNSLAFSRVGRRAGAPRDQGWVALAMGIAAAAGVLWIGFRHADSDVTDANHDFSRTSFQAAEPLAQQVGASSRIQACMAGEGAVCNALGVEIIQREGFTGPNADAARVSFDRACKAGNALGCNNLGVVLERISRGDSGENLDTRAADLFKRACDLGSSDGCSNLGAMHEHGWGVAQNISRAHDLYSRACDSGNALGCSNLGALYAQGRGVKRDVSRAETLFDRACSGQSQVGCSNLAIVVETN